MHTSDHEKKGPADYVERRVDFETAVLVELLRIYFNVFGPAGTARYIAASPLNVFLAETIFRRKERRKNR